ncbi:plasmid transfer protein TraA [Streptomyces sp. NBC_00340]|uniref:plasmid transfer protein TraA n=1 Tax=Streptomyces sp. NBC_00340 TaxID=2975716 RepID=UPI0022528214|nr:plasmid transfer protein TraA [Streptomyces sp. NBC_00340]MCX5137601.1 plasmid transfer protein TraA [Streptomyces sp. NBC_00340]
MASNGARRDDTPSSQVRAFAQRQAQQPLAPPRPNRPPSNAAPVQQRNRSTKVRIDKVSLVPDMPSLPPLSFSVNKTVVNNNGGGNAAKGAPGGDFMSNEDIRAFCEAGRKDARIRAVNRALDAATMEGRLSNIPDQYGSLSGSRARARRVVRWLKRVAAAEKMIARWYAALYAAFEREYESELMKIGRGRTQVQHRQPFNWR